MLYKTRKKFLDTQEKKIFFAKNTQIFTFLSEEKNRNEAQIKNQLNE
jgi:hypothetical protein